MTTAVRTPTAREQLPETGFVRVPQIIGTVAASTGKKYTTREYYPALIPVSRAGWWQGVKEGRFPQPIKLSPTVTVWRAEDIRNFIKLKGNEVNL